MNEQLPDGLQLAVNMLDDVGADNETAINAIFAEHTQRLTLQHHACDQAQRIADLETKCCTLKDLHDAAADERDRIQSACDDAARGWRADRDALERREVDFQEMLVAEHRVSGAYVDLRVILGAMNPPSTEWPNLSQYVECVARDVVKERDELRSANADLHSQVAYWHRKAVETRNEGGEIESQLSGQLDVASNELRSVMAERDALRAKLAEIEAQEPVAWQCRFASDGDAGWSSCSREHYAMVHEETSGGFARDGYEVRALIAAAPEHKA